MDRKMPNTKMTGITMARLMTLVLIMTSLLQPLTVMAAETPVLITGVTAASYAGDASRYDYGYMSPYEPALAADGDKTSPWSRWYGSGQEKWIRYTLPQTYSISRWDVYGIGGLENGRSSSNLRGYQLQTSMTGSDWTTVDTVSGNTANSTTRTLPAPVAARYARLLITAGNQNNNNWASVEEFELYGLPVLPVSGLSIRITAPRTGAVPETAITETNEYTGTVTWSPQVNGTFSPNTVYTAAISLTAKPGYSFAGIQQNAFQVDGAAAANSAGTGNITAVYPATGIEIKYQSNDMSFGTVSPSSEYVAAAGTAVGSVASPSGAEYAFVNWTDSKDAIVSTDSRFVPSKNAGNEYEAETYTANFVRQVRVSAVSVVNGTTDNTIADISGAAYYMPGSTVTLTATAHAGYRFKEWQSPEGTVLGYNPEYVIASVTKPETVRAVFEAIRYKVSATMMIGGTVSADAGTIAGTGSEFLYDGNTTLTVTPNTGYTFLEWKLNGNTAGDDTNLSVNDIREDRNYVAMFQMEKRSVTAVVSPLNAGTVTGAGDVDYNTAATLKAIPEEGYHFVGWVLGDREVSRNNPFTTPAVIADTEYKAVFSPDFTAVSGIEDVPDAVTAGAKLTLRGTVVPDTADNRTIVWSIKDAGGTGAELNGNTLKAASAGTVTLEARIQNGLSQTEDYTETFTVTVNAASGRLLDDLQTDDVLTEGQKIEFASPADASSSDAEFNYFDANRFTDYDATPGDAVFSETIKAGITYTVKAWKDAARNLVYTIWHVFKISVDENTGIRNIFLNHNPIWTVSFDPNGGTCGVGSMYADENGYLNALPDPGRPGYSFAGWYDSKTGGNRITASTQFDMDDTLYAHWTGNTGSPGDSGSSGSGNGTPSGSSGNVSGTWIGTTPGQEQGDTKWQLKLADGTLAKDTWVKTDNKWYHFDSNGYAQTGWVLDNGKWYHCDPQSCAMDTGLYHDSADSRDYYMNPDGSMVTGWVTIDGKQYYFNPDQAAATYAYDPVTQTWIWNGADTLPYGAMLKNTVTPDGHRVDETGARID